MHNLHSSYIQVGNIQTLLICLV